MLVLHNSPDKEHRFELGHRHLQMRAESVSTQRASFVAIAFFLGLFFAKGGSFSTDELNLERADKVAAGFEEAIRIERFPAMRIATRSSMNLIASKLDGIFEDASSFDLVESGIADQQSESSTPFLIPSSTAASWSNINWRNQDVTIVGGAGRTVLNLSNFVLQGGLLTLEGTATASFIINVQNQFSLSKAAHVVLAGGIQALNVVFNVLEKRRNVSIRQRSILWGVIEAPERKVHVNSHSTVFGEVFAARIKLTKRGRIVPPPVVSP
jgi:Ice-binding-like